MAVTMLALGAAAFFGLALVLTQLGLRHLPPLRGACISIPTTALAFLALSPVLPEASAWQANGAVLFAVAGLLFPAAVTLLTFEANRRIGPDLTGALGNMAPLFAVLIAFLVLGEVPRPGQIAGIAVVLAGVALMMWSPASSPASMALGWAAALPLAAAFIRGLVQPLVKLGLESWPSPFAAALIGYLVSAGVVLTAGAAREGRLVLAPPLQGWLWFSAVGVCNGLAVLTMYAALARGPVAVVAPLVACYPLATLLFGRALPGAATLSWRMGLAVAITVAGIALLLSG